MTGTSNLPGKRIIIRTEPDYDVEDPIVEFRLTYEGQLFGASRSNTRVSHKHEIRKVFHHQLRWLWEVHPYLSTAYLSHRREGRATSALGKE